MVETLLTNDCLIACRSSVRPSLSSSHGPPVFPFPGSPGAPVMKNEPLEPGKTGKAGEERRRNDKMTGGSTARPLDSAYFDTAPETPGGQGLKSEAVDILVPLPWTLTSKSLFSRL